MTSHSFLNVKHVFSEKRDGTTNTHMKLENADGQQQTSESGDELNHMNQRDLHMRNRPQEPQPLLMAENLDKMPKNEFKKQKLKYHHLHLHLQYQMFNMEVRAVVAVGEQAEDQTQSIEIAECSEIRATTLKDLTIGQTLTSDESLGFSEPSEWEPFGSHSENSMYDGGMPLNTRCTSFSIE